MSKKNVKKMNCMHKKFAHKLQVLVGKLACALIRRSGAGEINE